MPLLVSLGQEVGVLLVGSLDEVSLSPEVGGEVSVGLGAAAEDGLDEVTHGLGLSSGGGVAIVNTSELENPLGGGGSDEPSTAGSGDQTDSDGSRLSGDLG